jgi:glyoxylase-like metal-dependent hydrolase (beta-lactamase superfamily II)
MRSREKRIVVDPGDDVGDIEAILAKHQLTVKMIVITHAHIDHIGGAAKPFEKIAGAPVIMNPKDQELYERRPVAIEPAGSAWSAPSRPPSTPRPKRATRSASADCAMHVLRTPGHTQGSTCLYLQAERTLIAGDTLFRDSIGRTDLPAGRRRAHDPGEHQDEAARAARGHRGDLRPRAETRPSAARQNGIRFCGALISELLARGLADD